MVTPQRTPGWEEACSAGMELAVEWRGIRDGLSRDTGLERARDRERVVESELEMLGERGPPLPPDIERVRR